ncbi:hypothetical protein V3589_11385 [Sinorhizobium fredii]|uniref:hypothetical protein n=1 Tax=Rhizobium fredii TaxID=380 RepID=UPI0030994D1A
MSVKDEWGVICPFCKTDEGLDIQALVWVRLCDDGTDTDNAQSGDHEWDEHSACACVTCGWQGTVKQASEAWAANKGESKEDEE